MSFSLTLARLLAALALVLGGAACNASESASSPHDHELVGTVDGTNAFIGVVLGSDHAVAYVCDGTDTSATVSQWLDGAATDNGFDLSASGVRVKSAFSAGVLTGTVMLADGSSHAFSAGSATAPAGLYRDSSSYDGAVGGWIVLSDGRIRGAVRIEGGGPMPATSTVTSAGVVSATSGNLVLTGARVVSSAAPKPPANSGAGSGCTAAMTCSGHGLCSATGACACNAGFAGASCSMCAAGSFGFPTCKPCSAVTTCNGHGTCDATGACACNTGFGGASCSTCAASFFGFPTCRFCSAATTCNGHGTCDATGACACNAGFDGASCSTCAASFFGFPTCKFCSAATTCNGHGTCDTTGACVCDMGFSGPSCQ